VFWFLTGAAGSKRVVFGGDSVGSSKNSHGYVWVDTPPIKIQNVSRNFSVAANGYVNVAVSAPAVSGYTYLGLVGCRQGVDARVTLFSMSPSDVGLASRASTVLSGSITLTLIYGRNGS